MSNHAIACAHGRGRAHDRDGRGRDGWGTQHGFTFDDRPAYDARADARHWAALLELFARNLRVGAAPTGDITA
jgi:hypothetical protein